MEYKIGYGQRVISVGNHVHHAPPDTPEEKHKSEILLIREGLRFKQLQERSELQKLKRQFDEICDRINNIDYCEIEQEFVPSVKLDLARSTLRYCAEQYGLNLSSVELRFFEEESPACKDYLREYGVRDWRHFRDSRTLLGKVQRSTIWIKADLEGAELVKTAAHELFHIARPAATEEQAEEYARQVEQSLSAAA